ncbi:MAG: right-handed parallel beta-helix repeat-containing protein, partial [Thermoplasmatales archaeon]|nr:right-handed parallel beta-helix repeat-containing protein [Thermoplasmatales archaeon]
MSEKNKNNNAKSTIVVCSIGVVVLMGVLTGIMMIESGGAESGVKSASQSKAYTSHEPIYIDGNSGFNATNGVSAGDGSISNPYIIENWDINASSAHGIHIENTDVYFIVRNCMVHDGGINIYGIYFYDVINGKIDNITSYRNYYGVLFKSSSNNYIANSTIYNNSYHGIVFSSSSNINTIANCYIYNNDNQAGIQFNSYSSNNTIVNCTVDNHSWSITLYSSSNNTITNCVVHHNSVCGIGLDSVSNNNHITECTLYNNFYYGIFMGQSSDSNQIKNCSVTNSDNYDLYLNSSSSAVVLNTTFTKTKVYFGDASSTLTVKHYLHTKVINSTSSPISGATVRVRDNINGTFDQKYITNSDGWVRWIECTEYWQNQTSKIYYTPHNVTASKTGYVTNYAEPNMGNSKEITITLSTTTVNNPPNPPTLVAPANNTWTNDNTPYFDWEFNDPDAGDTQNAFNLTISQNSDFSTIDYWSNMTDSNTYYNWPSTLSDGIWYWRVKVKDNNGAWGDWSGWRIIKVDTVKPISSINTVSPYWQTSTPFTITATANDDNSGVANVSLYYRYSSDNASWGSWTLFSTDTSEPWEWNFTAPNGNGYYEFYSIATDNANNVESAPGCADAMCGYDHGGGVEPGTPTSSLTPISPFWKKTTPLTITATANDDVSGVASVELWYRYATEWPSFGVWILFAADTAEPWEWNFDFPNGTGYYHFYTRARDIAGNNEGLPPEDEAIEAGEVCGYDPVSPTSSVNPISPYWQTSAPFTVAATASDDSSGVANVSLYYRYSNDNSTWGSWILFGTDTAPPWSWSFTAPNGNGYYEFYSIAWDNASNNESAPVSADAICSYDNAVPTSSANIISPYWQTSSPITVTATASDTVSGLASVELWYRYSTNNATFGSWTLFGTDSASPWSWSFTAPNGNGYYEFYSIAVDNAGNTESAPTVADAMCCVNVPDTEKPEISNVQAVPETQVTGGYVNITCTVTDNVAVSCVKVNISWSGGFSQVNITMTRIAGIDVYYYNATYTTVDKYRYYIWANDTSNNQNISIGDEFIISAAPQPPTNLSIVINNGATYTNSSSVTLTLCAENATEMMISNDQTFAGGVWEVYATSKVWLLLTGDGNKTVYFKCRNDVGESEPVNDSIILDTTAPTTTYMIDGTMGDNGWYVSDVTLTIAAADETSGVAYIEYRIDGGEWTVYTSPIVISADGIHTVEFRAVDNAGNRGVSVTVDVKIDNTSPVTTAEVPPEWSNKNVTINLTAYDGEGSGVATIYYQIDGTEWVLGTTVTILAPSGHSNDGIHTIYYYSVDNAGNTETPVNTIIVRIDTTPPISAPSLISPENNSTVLTATPTFVWSAVVDELSGIFLY